MLIVGVVTTLFVWQKKKENLISKCKTKGVDKAGKKPASQEIFRPSVANPSGDNPQHTGFFTPD